MMKKEEREATKKNLYDGLYLLSLNINDYVEVIVFK